MGWRFMQGATPEVAWRISTEPQDAFVLAESDGTTLCSTPCVLRRTRSEGYETLVLRKPGFRDQRLELPLGRGEQRHRRLEAEPKEGVPVQVSWKIDSDPQGAEVVRADGQLLGTTPWELDRPPGTGETVLTLRHPGFKDKTLLLSHSTDVKTEVYLDPVAATPAPPAPGPEVTERESTPASPLARRRKQAARGGPKPADGDVKLLLD